MLDIVFLNLLNLKIGGQRIDKHYADWLQVWSELTMPAEKQTAYDSLVGGATDSTTSVSVYVPLQFWFCRNVGLALPLIALQYHEVKVNIELASLTDLSYSDSETLATTLGLNTDDFVATIATGPTAVTLSSVSATNTKLSTVSVPPTGTPISGIELWADYIYLDVEERKRFAQVSHEYLID